MRPTELSRQEFGIDELADRREVTFRAVDEEIVVVKNSEHAQEHICTLKAGVRGPVFDGRIQARKPAGFPTQDDSEIGAFSATGEAGQFPHRILRSLRGRKPR
jgi:hypothetical protein